MEVGGTEAGCLIREPVEVDGGRWLRLRDAEGKQAWVTRAIRGGKGAEETRVLAGMKAETKWSWQLLGSGLPRKKFCYG